MKSICRIVESRIISQTRDHEDYFFAFSVVTLWCVAIALMVDEAILMRACVRLAYLKKYLKDPFKEPLFLGFLNRISPGFF